jgi:uncharacterized OsmC-like protein
MIVMMVCLQSFAFDLNQVRQPLQALRRSETSTSAIVSALANAYLSLTILFRDFDMVEFKGKTRRTGATAVLGRTGFPHVTSVTGGEIDVVTAPSQAGFNPLDLLYASLSACLVLSARMAASQMGVLDKLTGVTAEVTGEKAAEGVSRIETFNIVFTISGDFDEATRQAIAHAAEDEICTVSNTLRGNPKFTTIISG